MNTPTDVKKLKTGVQIMSGNYLSKMKAINWIYLNNDILYFNYVM